MSSEPPHPTRAFRSEPFEADGADAGRTGPSRSAFAPIALIALSTTLWSGFQTVQLVRELQQLEAAKVGLAPQELAATKLRTALDQVATATARLASEGNGNARALVEQLRSRGVTIGPPAASAPP